MTTATATALAAALLAYTSVHCVGGEIVYDEQAACRVHDDCPTGQICFNNNCATLCNYDRECAADQVCAAGVCLDAATVGCQQPPDCPTSMMEHPECFDVTCAGGRCIYAPQPDVSCQEAYCRTGIAHNAYTCGERGFCDVTGEPAESCDGYACDADGSNCLTSCAGPNDCAEGYECLGASCATDLGRPGEICSASEPCIPTATCLVDVCRSVDGQACTANEWCASGICVAGICQSGPSELYQSCDDADDCAGNLSCADNFCRRPSGGACDLDGDCAERNCECDDSPCSTRTCADADCVCGYGPAGSCLWSMDGGIQDPQDCEPNRGCVGGSCTNE